MGIHSYFLIESFWSFKWTPIHILLKLQMTLINIFSSPPPRSDTPTSHTTWQTGQADIWTSIQGSLRLRRPWVSNETYGQCLLFNCKVSISRALTVCPGATRDLQGAFGFTEEESESARLSLQTWWWTQRSSSVGKICFRLIFQLAAPPRPWRDRRVAERRGKLFVLGAASMCNPSPVSAVTGARNNEYYTPSWMGITWFCCFVSALWVGLWLLRNKEGSQGRVEK